jgi:hypothetical protein
MALYGTHAADAIEDCRRRLDECAPVFRAVIERAVTGTELADADLDRFFVGVHLLAEARDTSIFPALMKVARLEEEKLEMLLGDALTEGFSNFLISVFDGDAEALFDAAASREVDQFARGQIFHVLAYLAFEGKIDRERLIGFLDRFERERLADGDPYLWSM